MPLPPDLAIVVLDSGVRHRLEDSGYAERRAELDRALKASQTGELGELERRRLRHVVTENERVRECVAALEAGGSSMYAVLGRSFRAGHESLRDDYEVSTPELDLLVEIAYEEGAVAARMTGGGFGGSVVALVDAEVASSVATAVTAAYVKRTGRKGRSFVCSAVDGAGAPTSATRS